jgi:uncharacterized protein YxeA
LKKGIIITIIILIAITASSFIFWVIPQEIPQTLVVSDFENYLDRAKKIHETLQESTEDEFQNLLTGKTSPEDYIAISDITSSQVTAQISEFVTTKPPEEWQGSYISHMEALKKFNSYVIETKVFANMIKNNNTDTEILQKIDVLKSESHELLKKSDSLRPK